MCLGRFDLAGQSTVQNQKTPVIFNRVVACELIQYYCLRHRGYVSCKRRGGGERSGLFSIQISDSAHVLLSKKYVTPTTYSYTFTVS